MQLDETGGFRLEALTDFVDDALAVTFTEKHIDSMMATLAGMGVTRVSWAYYGDGHGGYVVPSGLTDRWTNLANTYRLLGNPLRIAVAAAHRHGMELYAYYKPYETGPAICLPEGSPEAQAFGVVRHQGGLLAWLDPFVVENPDLRIRHRPDTRIRDLSEIPIRALRLTKRDASPTRITAEHLQIWTSWHNYQYQPLQVAFEMRDEVVPALKGVDDIRGTRLTHRGDPVRTLTLTGLNLTDPYILVTTDFSDGPTDFTNAGTDMLTALDEEGHGIPGVQFSGAMIYLAERINFRNHGLVFDCGYGRSITHLDGPNAAGNCGCVAFMRGRNDYLLGALCGTEPAVREFWLACIREMIDAGVDGVDLRVEHRLRSLIEIYEPHIIAVENPSNTRMNASPLLRDTVIRISITTLDTLRYYQLYGLPTIKQRLCGSEKATRQDMVERILVHYPHLVRYTKDVSKWQDAYWCPMFAAVAVGMICIKQ